MALAFAEKIHQSRETDLADKKIPELLETAVQLGCSSTEMEEAMDAENPKSKFIPIIVEKAKTVVEEAEAEQARQLEFAAEEKAALLRFKGSQRLPHRWWKSRACIAEHNAWGNRKLTFDVRIAVAVRGKKTRSH